MKKKRKPGEGWNPDAYAWLQRKCIRDLLLHAEPVPRTWLMKGDGIPSGEITEALRGLEQDGVVVRVGRNWKLTDKARAEEEAKNAHATKMIAAFIASRRPQKPAD